MLQTRTSQTKRSDQQGSALIAVLVVLGVAATLLLVAQNYAVNRSDATYRQAQDMERMVPMYQVAQLCLQKLADDEDLLADHPSEPWAEPVEIVSPDGTIIRTEIIDANRFLDLNNGSVEAPNLMIRSPREVLIDLLNECRLPDDPPETPRVDALIDYIDENNDGQYEEFEDAPPLNASLTVWSDLQRIAGWDPSNYDRERIEDPEAPPHPRDTFTILPDQETPRRNLNKVNINTAAEHVLRGLAGQGVKNQVMVEQIITFRKETPIRDLTQYFGRLPPAELEAASAWLDTKSSHFFIYVSSETADGDTLERTVLAHRNAEGKVKVLQWRP